MFTFLNDALLKRFPILNNTIFSRCLKKNIDLNVIDDVGKNQNIMLTMQITDIKNNESFLFWLNNQTFAMALYGVPKPSNIMENIVLSP